MKAVRAALHPLALGGLVALSTGPYLVPAALAGGAVALLWASLWPPLRRWCLAPAWAASLGALAFASFGAEAGLLQVVAMTALLAALVAALHEPVAHAPPPRLGAVLALLLCAATVASALVWGPSLVLEDRSLALQDPMTAAGAGLRVALACLAFAAATGLLAALVARLRNREAIPPEGAGVAPRP